MSIVFSGLISALNTIDEKLKRKIKNVLTKENIYASINESRVSEHLYRGVVHR